MGLRRSRSLTWLRMRIGTSMSVTLKAWLRAEIVTSERFKNTSQTDARATYYTGRLQALKDVLARVVKAGG